MIGNASAGTHTGLLPRILNTRRNLLFLTGLIAIAAIACGSEESVSVSSAPSDSGSSSVTLETIKDNLPLDFPVKVYQRDDILGGTELNFSDIVALGKPVVLNAWAGLCPPCRAEMPDLQAVYEEFEDHIILLGLDLGPFTALGNEQDARDLIAEIGVTYPAGNTDTARVVSKYKLLGMPSTVFITPDGKVKRSWTGLLNERKLRELVTELIAAS